MNRSKKSGNKVSKSYKPLLFLLFAAALVGVLVWKPATPLVAAITDTLDLRPEPPGPKLVYSELQGDTSIIWQAPATDLKKKRRLASVPHVHGYSIKASLSPDGRYIAYKVLSQGSYGSTSNSSLWLLDIESQRTSLILEGVELIGTPTWSPAGDKVAVVKTSIGVDGLSVAMAASVDIISGEIRTVATSQKQEWLSPVAWSADGTKLYYVSTGGQGTYLNYASIDGGDSAQVLSKLDDFSRDFHLSPNGEVLAYTSINNMMEPAIKTLSLSDGSFKRYAGVVSPLWDAEDGTLTVASFSNGPGVPKIHTLDMSVDTLSEALEACPEPCRRDNVSPQANKDTQDFITIYSSPKNSFHFPLDWSPDHNFLVVRSLLGASLNDVIEERLGVVDASATFRSIQATGYAEFIGWLP